MPAIVMLKMIVIFNYEIALLIISFVRCENQSHYFSKSKWIQILLDTERYQMKHQTLLLALVLILFSAGITYAAEKRGLLIVAHGAPYDAWNQPVLDVEKQVKEILDSERPQAFAAVRVALMEFTQPSIASAIDDMEEMDIDRLYILPMFIGPSDHTFYDLPTILGLHCERQRVEQLREEGIKIVDTDIKLTIGPVIDVNTITEVLIDRVRGMIDDPTEAALVIMSHGDRGYEPQWEQQSKTIGAHICGTLGMRYFDYAFVGMGQGFRANGAPVLFRALEKHETILVVSMYLSMGVEMLAMDFSASGGQMHSGGADMFSGHDVRFASQGILPDRRIARWVANKAGEWLDILDRPVSPDSHD